MTDLSLLDATAQAELVRSGAASPAELVDQLHGLVDVLSSLDSGACTPGELQQLLVRLENERARLAVATASVACEWEHRGAWQADGSLRPQLARGSAVDTASAATRTRRIVLIRSSP